MTASQRQYTIVAAASVLAFALGTTVTTKPVVSPQVPPNHPDPLGPGPMPGPILPDDDDLKPCPGPGPCPNPRRPDRPDPYQPREPDPYQPWLPRPN